jgi:hypothetical protein
VCPTGMMIQDWLVNAKEFVLPKSSDRQKNLALAANDYLDRFVVHATTVAATATTTMQAEWSPLLFVPSEASCAVTETPSAKRPCENSEDFRATKKQLFVGAVEEKANVHTPVTTSACC